MARKSGVQGSRFSSPFSEGSAPPTKGSVMPTADSRKRQGQVHINQRKKGDEAAKTPKKVLAEEETNEDIYCQALAQTLHHLALPVTVGFYGEWGRNKRRLLDTIQDQLCQRSEQKKHGKGEARTLRALLRLLWHIMFYLPVSSSAKPPRVRYLFVNFNAWEYVGCDHTWAGLVTALLDEIEGKNLIPFSVFRAFGGEFWEEPGPPAKKWVLKPWSKSYLLYVLVLLIVFTLCALLLRKVVGHHAQEAVGYMVIPVLFAICFPFLWAWKNVWFTLKRKLQREMSRKDLAAQLGFMHSVKQEMETILKFLQFMAFREEREMRVVLKITNLDLCTPDKVMGVLDAMSTLFSDKDAPFVSILAADPGILAECIQWSSNTCSNGYLYLDRIVSLPFSLPQMSSKAKRQLLKEILTRKKKREKNRRSRPQASNPLATEDIHQILLRYLSNENRSEYIPGNSTQMKRVVNTVLTISSMLRLGFKPRLRMRADGREERLPATEEVMDWVILANSWPCRLSWILQCEEDDRQQRRVHLSHAVLIQLKQGGGSGGQRGGEAGRRDRMGLLAFYEENAGELDQIKYKIRKLLELDGDPDLFRIFLQKRHFTVQRARYFADLLINLDFSLKRQFAFLRGLNGIIRCNKFSTQLPPTDKIVSWRVLKKKIPSEQKENEKGSELLPSCLKTQMSKDLKDLVGSAPSTDSAAGVQSKTPVAAKTWKLNIYN